MKVAGIDLSTKKVAVALIDGQNLHWTEIVSDGRRAGDRFVPLVQGFDRLLRMSWFRKAEVVAIEDISFLGNRKNELDMAMVQGAVMSQLELAGFTVQTCNNSTVKAAFNMMRQGKAPVQRLVEKMFSQTKLSEDVADAALVAMYMRTLVEGKGT